jgi:hypothetical protein
MQKLNDIASLIAVRDYLSASVENMRVKLSREEIKDIQTKVAAMDHLIVREALKFNVSEFEAPKNVITAQYEFQAAEDVEDTVRKMSSARGFTGIAGPVLAGNNELIEDTFTYPFPTGPDASLGVRDVPTSKVKRKK